MLLLTLFITFDTIDHDILLNRLETAFDIIIKGVVPLAIVVSIISERKKFFLFILSYWR